MGQAKKRGTFEQRRQLAEIRNELVTQHIEKSGNGRLKMLLYEHGIQRVACSLVATGLINQITPPEPEKPKLILPPTYANPPTDRPGPDPFIASPSSDGWGFTPSRYRPNARKG